jgi:dinuclear metal center YbgI/SA1388 family protein
VAGADIIITHHPMIFSGIKKINNHTFTGRKILTLIREGIVYYAMHTNYDILGMADLSAQYLRLADTEVLSVTEHRDNELAGFGRVGSLPDTMTLKECGKFVKEALGLSDVRVYGDLDRQVKRAAICTGSGKSMVDEAIAKGADVYVTGDIDHHTGIDTVAKGLAVIDAGHYGTEYIFMDEMKKQLLEAFPELEITCAQIKSPYTIL